MKSNYEFVKREIAGEAFLVPVGEAASVFEGIFTLNELGAFIFDHLEECASPEDMARAVVSVYDTDFDTALQDVNEFFAAMKESGITVE